MNVRLISATAKNMIEELKEGRFREDLYYRLNVVNIFLPPLRERGVAVEELTARPGASAGDVRLALTTTADEERALLAALAATTG